MRRVQKARKAAEDLLASFEPFDGPVPVEKIASRYARIVERQLDPGISGALVPVEDDQWLILVNQQHAPTRKRFTIAHELGHLRLHGFKSIHADRAFKFRDVRSSEGSAAEEIEANQFAAELLMPRRRIMEAAKITLLEYAPVDDEDPAFDDLVSELALKFGVSRQAMAIRLSSLLV
jgi:Zn-dependent peptidase ImmA (M78 family)